MDGRRAVVVAAGGVLGAWLRWAAVEGWPGHGPSPVAVLGVNVLGSLLLGVVVASDQRPGASPGPARDAAAIGFCGGLTTFSTFAVDVARLLDGGRPVAGAALALCSVVLAVAAVVAGIRLGRRRWEPASDTGRAAA